MSSWVLLWVCYRVDIDAFIRERRQLTPRRPNGWCGNGEEHCGASCQANFGECGSPKTPQSSPAPNSQVSPPSSSSVVASSGSNPSILPTISDQASSDTGSQIGSPTNSVPDKAPAEGPRQGRPSHGAPVPTLITKSYPGASSTDDAETGSPSNPANSPPATPSPSAEPTSSPPAQPSAPAPSPPAPPQPSEQPTSYGPPSSAPASTSTSSATQTFSSGVPSPSQTSGGGRGSGGTQSEGGTYIKQYMGDGSSGAGWPSENDWLDFDTLWKINQDILKKSCSNAFYQSDNTDQELSDLKSALDAVSASSGIDKAFIFAIMMQESNGCVRAPTTVGSHANPGLFQSHEGEGSCNIGGSVQNPCPKNEIDQMVKDGVEGTAAGDGLKQLLGKAEGDGAQRYYRVARMYNSGSMDPSGNLGLGGATHCYCSDIANRLTGWSKGVTGCDATSVGA